MSTFVPADGLYFVPPNYAYPAHGGPPVTFNSWTYNSGAGLITGPNPGAFGGEPSFVGNQYAFIQSLGSSLSQTFSATPGIGEIDWLQAGRPDQGSAQGNQTLQIYLNGNLVGTVASLTGQDFAAKSISGVTLLSSNTLLFLGLATGDNTAFIDEVSVTTTSPTPLPAAVWLFGSVLAGGAGFGSWRKRKAKSAAA